MCAHERARFLPADNNETGDTTWDKPAELMTEEEKAAKDEEPEPEELPEWAKVYDPASEDYYCPCDFLQFALLEHAAFFAWSGMFILALCQRNDRLQ